MKLKGLTRLGVAGLSVGVLSAGLLFGGESAAKRLKTAGVGFTEIMGAPDKGIPQDLLESCQCSVIIPGQKKAAFIVGGTYGSGFMLCRHASGLAWSAPAGVKIEGGSVGFQIGGSETDVIVTDLGGGAVHSFQLDGVAAEGSYVVNISASKVTYTVSRSSTFRVVWGGELMMGLDKAFYYSGDEVTMTFRTIWNKRTSLDCLLRIRSWRTSE